MLGLIFLTYADERFAQAAEALVPGSARRPIGPDDYLAAGALYLPEQSRFETLLDLPEGADLGRALNRAMGAVERIVLDGTIVADPEYSSGRPTIAGRRLRADVLAEAVAAGERRSEVARMWDVAPAAVDDAVRFLTLA